MSFFNSFKHSVVLHWLITDMGKSSGSCYYVAVEDIVHVLTKKKWVILSQNWLFFHLVQEPSSQVIPGPRFEARL